MTSYKFCCLCILIIFTLWSSTTAEETVNERPIIGILTQEVSRMIKRVYKEENYQSYIAGSYVNFVQGSGGRVVPIMINRSRDYYEDILSKVNGVLMPGGSTFFNNSAGYADAGAHIYEIAKQMNDRGDYMPIWGTCLGFEFLVYIEANRTEYRTDCSSYSQALPLQFLPDYEKSRLFAPASADMKSTFQNYNVTINFHRYCFTPEIFEANQLNDIWDVISLNKDTDGVTFVSTIEHKKYPFYGVQFHPEKVLYEFITNRNIPHNGKAVEASQYLANFFLSETRKNTHSYKDPSEEQATLIYNYCPKYTGSHGSVFLQQYLFKATDPQKEQENNSTPLLVNWALVLLAALFATF